ncbi:MAG: peptidylprolyl isomerase [Actinomycetota bacterium]
MESGSASGGQSPDRRIVVLLVFLLLLGAVVAAILIARGGDDGSEPKSAGAAGCEKAEKPEPREEKLSAPPQEVRRGEELTAVVVTSCGEFSIALDTGNSPKTVNSFVYLAGKGFYDGLHFHRIVTDFVVQGGDPKGNGEGGPGYFVDEPPPPNQAYTKGIVAMAKSAADPPGRSGSQFFVVIPADAGLSPAYAVLGRVSKGFATVERIGKAGTRSQEGIPKQTVLIDSVTIENG